MEVMVLLQDYFLGVEEMVDLHPVGPETMEATASLPSAAGAAGAVGQLSVVAVDREELAPGSAAGVAVAVGLIHARADQAPDRKVAAVPAAAAAAQLMDTRVTPDYSWR